MAAEADPAALLHIEELDSQVEGQLISLPAQVEAEPALLEASSPAEVIELSERRAKVMRTKALFRRLEQGDQHAEAELVEAYLPLAAKIARKYETDPDNLEDLKQVASLGLLQAIRRYDLSRGTAFSSFAYPTINGVIKRHLRDNTWGVHVKRALKEKALLVWHTMNDLERQGEHCELKDIAKALDLPYEEVQEAWSAMMSYRPGSLDEPINPNSDNTITYAEVTPANNNEDTIIDEVAHKIEREHILAHATTRNRRIYARYIMLEQTQAEVGRAEGISQMQVSRIVRQIKRGYYRLPQKTDT